MCEQERNIVRIQNFARKYCPIYKDATDLLFCFKMADVLVNKTFANFAGISRRLKMGSVY